MACPLAPCFYSTQTIIKSHNKKHKVSRTSKKVKDHICRFSLLCPRSFNATKEINILMDEKKKRLSSDRCREEGDACTNPIPSLRGLLSPEPGQIG